MYKLIIADDEKIIREGLAQMINWSELGFEIIGTFSEGEEVIECLDSMPVDVVLTDIIMPRIGGIDIARYVYDSQIPCKVVFISGHKEFELALQAIKYGVGEYILKPSKAEEIRTVFHKLKQELDTNLENVEFQNRVRKHWLEIYPILEEQFLSNLTMGALDDRIKIAQRMQFLFPEIDAERCPCFLAELEIRDYDSFITNSWNYGGEQFDDAIYNFVRIFEGRGILHILYKHKEKIKLLGIMKEYCADEQGNHAMCKALIEELSKSFATVFEVEIALTMNIVFSNIYQMVEKRENIIRHSGIKRGKEELLLQEQKKLILTNIIMGNISTSQKIMKNALKGLIGCDIQYCKDFVVDLFSYIKDSLQENDFELYRSIQPHIDYRGILRMSSLGEIEVYCNRIFEKMKFKDTMSGQYNKNGLVNRVKDYVQEHIREDIILENVSNEMFISVTHLSRIFKIQTGETFQQYVIRKKMEKAAELLLDPQYKVYQVGEYLGYKTPHYFSKVFYNFMGCYPAQYRKEVLEMGDVDESME